MYLDVSELADEICAFYGDDLDKIKLVGEIRTFQANVPLDLVNTDKIGEVINFLKSMSEIKRNYFFRQIIKICKLLLVMPATNAESERNFSVLRRVKTWLRSTMTQERLNNLMTVHVHKDKTDLMDMKRIAELFVSRNDRRIAMFGKFE